MASLTNYCRELAHRPTKGLKQTSFYGKKMFYKKTKGLSENLQERCRLNLKHINTIGETQFDSILGTKCTRLHIKLLFWDQQADSHMIVLHSPTEVSSRSLEGRE